MPFNPTPNQKDFVTIWHTCIDTENGTSGNQGVPERYLSTDEGAKDREQVKRTNHNLGYANLHSRKSAADSIRRAKALRAKVLSEQKATV